MNSSFGSDTYKQREANRRLKNGDVWVADVRWWPQVQQAMRTLSTAAMPRPDGLSQGGEFWLRTEVLADTGLIRYVLWYRETRVQAQGGIKLGWFVLDYLPERQRRPQKPVKTHGKIVWISVKRGGCAEQRPVRVLVDGDGLPVPVPPEIWRAMGLDGGAQ